MLLQDMGLYKISEMTISCIPMYICISNLDHRSLLYLHGCLDTRKVVSRSTKKPMIQFSMTVVIASEGSN